MAETSQIPEELEHVWTDTVAEAFTALESKQQAFLLKYLECWNGTESYRHAYNPTASDGVASSYGSQLLGNLKVKAVLSAFEDTRTEDLFLVRQTYVEAARSAVKPIYSKDSDGQPEKVEDLPDYDIRIKAAQSLAKLHGMNAPTRSEISGANGGPVVIQSTPLDEKL